MPTRPDWSSGHCRTPVALSAEDRGHVPREDGDETCAGEGEHPGTHDVAGDTPSDGGETLRRTDTHDRRGDRVRRRDRGAEREAGHVEDGGGSRLGREALRWREVDDPSAERAHDP